MSQEALLDNVVSSSERCNLVIDRCIMSQDLDVNDVMMLDSGEEIYIWIGRGSTEEERTKSLEVAMVRRQSFFFFVVVAISRTDSSRPNFS